MAKLNSRVLRLTEDKRLVSEEREVRTPQSGEVLVEVRGFGVNRADLLQRAGHYPAPPGAPQDILGLEFAGQVVRSSGRWQEGDRVMGICAGGGFDHGLIISLSTYIYG